MPLYVRDSEIDRLIDRLAARGKRTKTEIVREALRRECKRQEAEPDLVKLTQDFVRDLRARYGPADGPPADKAFIDSLYED